MSSEKLKLAIIIGSTREGRVGQTVGRWIESEARKRSEFTLDMIDLADVDLPAALPATPTAAISALVERIAAADAFVVVTPEYNHGYPASLKNAIDQAYAEWNAKPVGFVSYGGLGGGLRAVEQLRQIFPEVHAVTTRDGVSFHNAWDLFDDAGRLKDRDGPEKAAHTMLTQLVWWADALRNARQRKPYAQAA